MLLHIANSIVISLSIKSSDLFLPIYYACSRDSLYVHYFKKFKSNRKYNVHHSLLYYSVEREDIRIFKSLLSKWHSLVEMRILPISSTKIHPVFRIWRSFLDNCSKNK